MVPLEIAKNLANGTWLLLACAVFFPIAHTQAPLYYSNQNQYFLHGMAWAGFNHLDEDWLAGTADPTPVFSGLVAAAHALAGNFFFYVVYAALLVIYFVALAALPAVLPGRPLTSLAQLAYLTALVAVHAAIVRAAAVRLWGVDYPWYLQTGVANQYALGPGLQPSAFGVLLIASVIAFACGRPLLAVVSAALAAVFHPTYLITAALLTATYPVQLWRDGRRSLALRLGAGSLLLVSPVAVWSLLSFAPSSPDQFAEAQQLLAEFRIPGHALVEQWLDAIAVLQLLWMSAALVLVWRSSLFPVMLVTALAGVALSIVQVATDSRTLALLFPWRVSIILMPLATAVIFARFAGMLGSWLARRPAWLQKSLAVCCAGLLGAAVVGGLLVATRGRALAWLMETDQLGEVTVAGLTVPPVWSQAYRMDDGELPLLDFVRTHAQAGEVYLVPVTVPDLRKAPRGGASMTFQPPKRAAPGVKIIPVDLQRFRLLTGAPIYVDFKAIPYKDVEVLEWKRRIECCQKWNARTDWSDPELAAQWRQEGITHVVIPANRDLAGGHLVQVYADERYRIYRIATAQQ